MQLRYENEKSINTRKYGEIGKAFYTPILQKNCVLIMSDARLE